MADPVWALGAMSGTSMDGVDAAMVHTDGRRIFAFGPSRFEPFSPAEKKTILAAQTRWPGDRGVAEAAKVVEDAHLRALNAFEDADIIGFHGQTLAHDPAGGRTHQCGDGARLARELGVPVVWDFRTADVKLGGQGAPLAPFFHFALAKYIGAATPLAFLNLGGIGNLTWIDPSGNAPEATGALLAFDTGPANGPIDELLRSRGLGDLDRDGSLARQGLPDAGIVDQVLGAGYYHKVPPKSLDRAEVMTLVKAVADLSARDAAATLVQIAAISVAQGLQHCPTMPARVLVAGGGRHNPALMAALARALSPPVEPVEAVGLDGDMLEAQAFAFLAVRVANGLPTSAPGTTGVAAPVGGGTISRP